jgi:hypothetical protein
MSDIFVKFSYGCKNIDFGITTIKGWFLINLVNILWFTGFVVLSQPPPAVPVVIGRAPKTGYLQLYALPACLFFNILIGADKR